jgi:diguanylate cyclase (GGDEF)-like protein
MAGFAAAAHPVSRHQSANDAPLAGPADLSDTVVAGLPLGGVTPGTLRIALLVMAAFGMATVALLPVASHPGLPVAGFVPAYQATVFLFYAMSFLHLVTYVRHTGAVALLHIATGCLFSALILLMQMFSFPIWGPEQLVGSTPATTSWLWTFWHLGPTIFTFSYLAARWSGGPLRTAAHPVTNRAILLTAGGAVALVAAATAVSTWGLPWLPTIVVGDDYRALTTSGVGPAVLIATLLSLGILAVRTRCATQVELCLAISLVLLVMDDLLTLTGGSRLSLGWYAGRAEAALSAAMLLGLFLLEVNRRFTRVSVRAASLAELQEELTRRVDEQAETNAALARLARQDGLTQLANRRTLDEALASEWRRARREHLPLALLMIDVDHFKLYNDRQGHPAGDACLRIVARLIADLANRSGDLAARYGGEEFVLLLPGTDQHGARVIAETLRTALRNARIPHDATPSQLVTVSIGAASIVPMTDDDATETLVAAADQALYRAKRGGRDRVVAVAVTELDAGLDEPAAANAVRAAPPSVRMAPSTVA